ncbi:RDD family protein [Nitrosophilus alvini]|uniref:RDD family protein n=1 Tax=Nitrosophilus alvini TaxID=2714855 RepID=UPI00190E2FC2|nr:RDD family protein [Nitrosophilus alvini]
MARWRDIKQGKIEKPAEKKPNIKDNLKYATIPVRLKAFLTDTFMITMPIIYIVIYLIMGSRENFREHLAAGWLYIVIPHFFIIVILWYKFGQTPGMKAYSIKLIDNATKKKPSFFVSIFRYFTMILSIFSIFGILIPFFRKDSKALHDLLSNTSLVFTNEK